MNDHSALLSIQNVYKRYLTDTGLWRKPREIVALRDVSLQLPAGQTLAVVGESGSGKSTLARLVAGLETPDDGSVLIDGRSIHDMNPEWQQKLRREVRMIFQNPGASLNPRVPIGKQFDQSLQARTGLGPRQRQERINEALLRVGLQPDHKSHYPHQFSGGQRQRLTIARAILSETRLIVADEPVSALDASVQAQIINLLLDLQEDMQLSYLLISHDLGVVRHMSDAVAVLYAGDIMEQGDATRVFSAPRHPYTRALVAASPALRAEAALPAPPLRGELTAQSGGQSGAQACPFFARCPYAEPRCAAERPALREVDGRAVACHFAEQI